MRAKFDTKKKKVFILFLAKHVFIDFIGKVDCLKNVSSKNDFGHECCLLKRQYSNVESTSISRVSHKIGHLDLIGCRLLHS